MFITGGLLFMTQAGKAYGNAFFRAKLIFLVALGINAAVYQARLLSEDDRNGMSRAAAPLGAKAVRRVVADRLDRRHRLRPHDGVSVVAAGERST